MQGIYAIELELIDKTMIYYGSSCDITARWARHKRDLNNNIHDNQHLQRAWNKYGEFAFNFYVIEEVSNQENLTLIENEWLEQGKETDVEYYRDICFNIRPFANNNIIAEETKKRMSLSKKGDKNYMYNRQHSDESKAIMSDLKKGEKNPMFGRKQTEDTKQKISQAIRGENHYKTKLNNEKVSFIKFATSLPYHLKEFTHAELGVIFGVKTRTITDISSGRNWKHCQMMTSEQYLEYKITHNIQSKRIK